MMMYVNTVLFCKYLLLGTVTVSSLSLYMCILYSVQVRGANGQDSYPRTEAESLPSVRSRNPWTGIYEIYNQVAQTSGSFPT